MKRVKIILSILLCLVISGCVADSAKNSNDLNQKISKLESDLDAANKSKSETEDKLKQVENELIELKNGAQMSIIEIRKQYEAENYDKVLELTENLHIKFNGIPEDIEAQELVKNIQDIRAKEAKKAEEEKAKLLAEKIKSAKEKAQSILRVSKIYPSKPNSAGGVDLYIFWKNNSDKVIKYAVFTVEPFNAVNDVVGSEIGGESTFRAKETGPFKKGQGSGGDTYWENAWYNSTIKKVKLVSVDIEYMDGTIVSLKDDDIKYIQY